MSETESHGEETGSSREPVRRGKRSGRELRAQAELAWTRLQRVIQQRPTPALSVEGLLRGAQEVPTEGYLAGITSTLVASAWLYARGQRAGGHMTLLTCLALAAGLYAKSSRQLRRP